MSDEIAALLRFYAGRKLISVKDIAEFSETWVEVRSLMTDAWDDPDDMEERW